MEENYERMDDEAQKIIDGFNEHSRRAGRMTLFVTYTAIPSNRQIVKEFAEYAYEHSNNNYLSAIKKLMEEKKYLEELNALKDKMMELEEKVDLLRDYTLETIEGIKNDVEKEKRSSEESSGRKGPKLF